MGKLYGGCFVWWNLYGGDLSTLFSKINNNFFFLIHHVYTKVDRAQVKLKQKLPSKIQQIS